MNKQIFSRIHPLAASALVVAALLMLLFLAYGATRWLSSGEVMGRVDVAEAELGGQTVDEALNTVESLEIGRLNREASFEVDTTVVPLQPGQTGLDIDEETIVAQAMAFGRQGNQADQFLHWLTNIFETQQLELIGEVDDSAMDEIFDVWDTEVIAKPINLGGISLVNDELVPTYPSTGVGVLREPASAIVLDTLLAVEPNTPIIPTRTVEPELTDADVNRALDEAQRLLAAPIALEFEDEELTLSVDDLKTAFKSETIVNSPAEIINYFDPEVVDALLAPVRTQFEAEPIDAEYVIDGRTVRIEPGVNGTRIDEVETATRLFDAGLTDSRTGPLPVVEGAEPDVTTEYLESLKVEHLVSEFTTYHDCCEPRVTNIQLMADAIDGTLVLPGETFSINEHVGERTLEKGYLDAGSIVGGEIVDTVGGGVSQFATTFYNAVYWGGYEDVEHKPHSYYFTRYPEGVEATLFWRSIDLKFRNNRDHAVLIDTSYTGNSITVRFYGFNDDRTLAGEQSGGRDRIRVVTEGGPDALHVKSNTSDRFNITSPGDPVYRENPDLEPGSQKTIQSERDGWSVRVTRTILRNGVDLVEEREWVVRYRAQFAIYEVHPCNMPDATQACPTTTTTTIPSTTTTPPPGSSTGGG